MSQSTHAKALQSFVNDRMANDPIAASVICNYLAKMKSGHFTQTYVDSVIQNWGSEYDIYDAYAFSQFHYLNCSGLIATAIVRKGAVPLSDHQVDYHNQILQKRPGVIFYGEFFGGLADNDGYLIWDHPVAFGISRASEVDDTIEHEEVILAPRRLPLEVGYTAGSSTLMHLQLDGGLARWPY